MSSQDFPDRLPQAITLNGILDSLKYDRDGLVTVVAQEAGSKEVLVVAHANRTALELTLESGLMHYYSRSRKKLWKKGEESGHLQRVVDLTIDCDGDAILARVKQVKGCCHMGFRSCFSFKIVPKGGIKVIGKQVFDPKKAYAKSQPNRRPKK